jgi:hypothetical protein
MRPKYGQPLGVLNEVGERRVLISNSDLDSTHNVGQVPGHTDKVKHLQFDL